jgi:hypothetical protein
MAQLEEKLRAQEQRIQQEATARVKEMEHALARETERKRLEDERIAEEKRCRNIEQIERLILKQNEKSLVMEQKALAQAHAAELAAQTANKELMELQRRMEELNSNQHDALESARKSATESAERAAKAEKEVEEHKHALHSAREAAKNQARLIAEYTEKLEHESNAKIAAELAQRSAEDEARNLQIQKSRSERLAAMREAQGTYLPQTRDDTASETTSMRSGSTDESRSTVTGTDITMSNMWRRSSSQSLHQVRIQQEDLASDPSHKIIFPMRSGWKEHETKAMTKSMARFGYQPLIEEVESPYIPTQSYELPGSGGCILRGTALWQPPGPVLASELYNSLLRSKWKPTYVRSNGKELDFLLQHRQC